MQKLDEIILCFFGDGAANLGAFHEALNMAAIWTLPVVFVCENNQYAMSFAYKRAFTIEHISDRAAAYGMPGETVDGNDVLAVRTAVDRAVKRAREGDGPSLIENLTYRWRGHSKSDANRYRTKEEIDLWKEKCPIKRFKAQLLDKGILTKEEINQIEKDAYTLIDAAVDFAEVSPEPALETIEEGVYA
jgi:pyruvate dehydrogenase E1 component alpha subunit